MAKKYVGVETLEALMEIMKDELAKKVSAEDLGNLDSIKETITEIQNIKEQLEGIIGEDGVEKAKTADKATDADKLGGEDASAYAKVADLTEYLKTEDLIAAISDLEGMEDEEERKTASAKLVKELYDKVMAFEDALRENWDDEVEKVVESVLEDLKGEENGLATLDESGKVPAEQLPSYVDDVVEGYLVADTDDSQDVPYKFYVAKDTDGDEEVEFQPEDPEGDGAFEELAKPERGKIYVDLLSGMSYRWSGSMFVEISSGLVEMTEEEVQKIWDKVVSAAAADEEAEEDGDQQAAD